MARGGTRPNAGRTAIVGKEIKIKIPENIYNDVDENFTGKTIQEKIRDCLDYGVNAWQTKVSNISDVKYNGLMSIFWTQKVKLFYAALLANNSH